MSTDRIIVKALFLLALGAIPTASYGQPDSRDMGGRLGGRGFGGWSSEPPRFDRSQFPTWEIDDKFSKDVFTFVRIKSTPYRNRSSNRNWTADYPDADYYFSWRLQQLTTIQVNPDPIVVELTDPQLFNYPLIFSSGTAIGRFYTAGVVGPT